MSYQDDAFAYDCDVYCRSCADTAWGDAIRDILSNRYFDDGYAIRELRDLIDDAPRQMDADDCSKGGESCSQCGEELCEPYYVCDGCDHEGWPEDFANVLAIDDGVSIYTDDDGRPHALWCDECEDDNRHSGAAVLLEDDGRGYVLRYLPAFKGEMTYRQADGGYWVDDPTPIYVAGCRRFTLLDALRHWGAEHYTVRGRYEGCPIERTAAYRLSSAVLRHAMRQALPRIVIPSERATDDAYAAAAA